MKFFMYFKTLVLATVIVIGTAPAAHGMDGDKARRIAEAAKVKEAFLAARARRTAATQSTQAPAAPEQKQAAQQAPAQPAPAQTLPAQTNSSAAPADQPAQTAAKPKPAAKKAEKPKELPQREEKDSDKDNDPDALDLLLMQEIEALNVELSKRIVELTNAQSFAATGRVMAEIERYIQAHQLLNTPLTVEKNPKLKKNQPFLSAIKALTDNINNLGMAILQNKNNKTSITGAAHQQITTTIRLFETISGRQRLAEYFEKQFPNPQASAAPAAKATDEKKGAAKPGKAEQPKKADKDKKDAQPKAQPKDSPKDSEEPEDSDAKMLDQQVVHLQTLNKLLIARIKELNGAKSPEKMAAIIQQIEAEFKQFVTGKIDADTAKTKEFKEALAQLNAQADEIIKSFTDNKNYKIMRDNDSHLEAEKNIRLALHRIGTLINRKDLSVTESEMDTSSDKEQAKLLAEEEKKEAAKRQAKLAENDAKLARQLAQQNAPQNARSGLGLNFRQDQDEEQEEEESLFDLLRASRSSGPADNSLAAAVRSRDIDRILDRAEQAETKDIEQAVDDVLYAETTDINQAAAIAEMLREIIQRRKAELAEDAKKSRKRGRETKAADAAHDDEPADDDEESAPAKKKRKTKPKKTADAKRSTSKGKEEHPLLEAARNGIIETVLEIAADADDETLAQACTIALENKKQEVAEILLGITASRQEAKQAAASAKVSKKRKRSKAQEDAGTEDEDGDADMDRKHAVKPKAKAKDQPGEESPKKKQKKDAATHENTHTIMRGSYAECKEEEAKILKRAKPVDVSDSQSSKDGDSYNGLFRLNKKEHGSLYVRIVLESEEEESEEEESDSEEEDDEETDKTAEEAAKIKAALQERAKKLKKQPKTKAQAKKPDDKSRKPNGSTGSSCVIM